MNLDEAIVHAKDVANNPNTCKECRDEHNQLASWLEELKLHRAKENKELVFVYGTLMKEQSNYRFLKEEEMLGVATLNDVYGIYYKENFPAILNGDSYVSGELYKVSLLTLMRLDTLEGEGVLYNRNKVRVFCEDRWLTAWAYYLNVENEEKIYKEFKYYGLNYEGRWSLKDSLEAWRKIKE